MMERNSSILVNLHSPREKVWGLLDSIDSSGVTLIGLDLNSFDDWSREIARGDVSMGPSTVFFPMHRIERIHRDESSGGIQSLAEVFESRVGKDVWTHLGLALPVRIGEAGRNAPADELAELAKLERDYLTRVLKHTRADLEAAARILAIPAGDLRKKLESLGLELPPLPELPPSPRPGETDS